MKIKPHHFKAAVRRFKQHIVLSDYDYLKIRATTDKEKIVLFRIVELMDYVKRNASRVGFWNRNAQNIKKKSFGFIKYNADLTIRDIYLQRGIINGSKSLSAVLDLNYDFAGSFSEDAPAKPN